MLLCTTSLLSNAKADLYLEIQGDRDFFSGGTPLSDTPRSVQILDDDTPHYSSANRLEDVIDSVPGVTIGREQAGTASDLYIRGYSVGGRLYKDNLVDNQNLYIRDPATVETVEIIKGHDSTLFGSGSPGGTVNYISKKPQPRAQHRVKIGTGDPERARVEWDSTGQIRGQDNLLYRLVVARQEAETGVDHVNDNRFTVMPSLRWFNDKTQFTLSSEYSRQQRDFDFDSVLRHGQPVYNVSYVDPRGGSDRENTFYSAELEHQLTPNLALKIQGNKIRANRSERLSGYYYKLSEDTLQGYYREVDNRFKQRNLRSELGGTFQVGRASHKTRLGYERNAFWIDIKSRRAIGAFTLDILDPQFDFPLPVGEQLTPNDYWINTNDSARYLHHTMHWGRYWTLTAGLRKSEFSNDFNRTTLYYPQADSDALSSSLGINRKFANGLSLYANRVESWSPNYGRDKNDNFFDPKEAVQYEVGLRLNKDRWQTAVAAYHTTQDNLTTPDPDDRDYSILAGERQIKGLELNSKTRLGKQLDLTLGYTYMDAEITRDNNGRQGNTPNNIPRHSGFFNLGADLSLAQKPLRLDLGLTYVDERQGDLSNRFIIPPYARTDLSLKWKLSGKTGLNLSVKNLFDKDYVAASFGEDTLVLGYPRRAVLSISHDF